MKRRGSRNFGRGWQPYEEEHAKPLAWWRLRISDRTRRLLTVSCVLAVPFVLLLLHTIQIHHQASQLPTTLVLSLGVEHDHSRVPLPRNASDKSPRCLITRVCDGDYSCGDDGLGCLTQSYNRRQEIVKATKYSWNAYRQYAWGTDTLETTSKAGSQWMGLGMTIVDCLDTLVLMGLHEEFQEAREWVATNLHLYKVRAVSVFEVTIRVLGGLLSTYYLTADRLFLTKAQDLGHRLLPAFNATSSGVAFPYLVLATGKVPTSYRWWMAIPDGATTLADVGTLSLEFTTLARLTGRQDFHTAGMALFRQLRTVQSREGLHCNNLLLEPLSCQLPLYNVGGGADSGYEYMLKQWLVSNKTDQGSLELYKAAMRGVRQHLLQELRTKGGPYMFLGTLTAEGHAPGLTHLSCFMPGLLALGHHHGVSTKRPGSPTDKSDLDLAKGLMITCYEMYRQSVTGIAPEEVSPLSAPPPPPRPVDEIQKALSRAAEENLQKYGLWGKLAHSRQKLLTDHRELSGGDIFTINNPSFQLRPEVVESLFILWRVTRDATYREWGWQIFRAVRMYCQYEQYGYTSLDTADRVPVQPGKGSMPSFWIAETLKYLYLLFTDDFQAFSLDDYVFSTEAHPLPVWGKDRPGFNPMVRQ